MRALTLLALLVALSVASLSLTAGNDLATVSGVVMAGETPLSGAHVRVQATANLTLTADDGSFTLRGLEPGRSLTVTAWYTGCKIGWTVVTPPAHGLVLTLRPYDTRDNPDYVWNTSYPDPANPTLGCGHCMVPAFPEWQRSAHAGSATNQRFLSIYNGTNITGTQSAGPGFKRDNPDAAGNCAACHAPGAAANAPLDTDMNGLTGVNREGIFCEFCHKIGAVLLDPETGRPLANAPGVLSLRLHRTYPGDALFFGTLDDVTRRVSYLPLEQKSEFCAPCHQFSFGDTPVYESFREWQESPYPALGIECQTCHMPPGTSPTFVLPERGGLERDPERLASHRDLGLKDLAFMQSSLAMTVTAQIEDEALAVTVTLTNSGAGHHVPTDYPGRHLLLAVRASDAAGHSLTYVGTSLVPEWGGDLAGQPGKGFAKILQDVETGDAPVVSYWRPLVVLSDNRIPALATDTSAYRFARPSAGERAHISTRLVLRRAFQGIMDEKGWDEADIIMNEVALTVELPYRQRVYLPLTMGP